jgi:Ankyrin repeats (3 copies)
MAGKSVDYRHQQLRIDQQVSDKSHRTKPTGRALKSLSIVETLIAQGCPVDAADAMGRTPLHEACAHNRHALVSYLLSRGADPLAKDNEVNKPEIRPRHLRGLTAYFEEAMAKDDKVVLDHCLSAIEKCLPRRSAVKVLIEWAELSVHHEEAASRVHGIIRNNLPKGELLKSDRRYPLACYAVRYDCNARLDKAMAGLKKAGLGPTGLRENFSVEGEYAADKHGLLLVKLARAWLLNPDSDIGHPLAILNFVHRSAAEAKSPEVSRKLASAMTDLAAELHQSPWKKVSKRWEQVRDVAVRF